MLYLQQVYLNLLKKIYNKIFLVKQYFLENKKWFIIIGGLALILIVHMIISGCQARYIKSCNKNLTVQLIETRSELNYEKNKRLADIKIINEKVDALYTFIKRTYPYFNDFDYRKVVSSALENPKNIQDLPEDLFNIYITEKYIKPHNLNMYKWTLKNLCLPLKADNAFVTCKAGEYGQYRPYAYMGYKHEGLDMVNPFDNSVYAVYNATVWKKYYEEGSGWNLEIKFQYWNNKTDRNEWYFVRYRHLEDVYVKVGQNVKKGEIIANMGNTGYFSRGKHLHIELWQWNAKLKRYININPVQNSTYSNKVISKIRG